MNYQSCGWIKNLPPRNNVQAINKNFNCDWIVIGAGYTGLSTARKLGDLHPNSKIIIVDSNLAGEGASSRNSGYLVDTTLNDGFTSNKDLRTYKKKTDIYKAGIETVKKFIKEYQVNCDWNECGKYFASSQILDQRILNKFSKTLNKLNFKHEDVKVNEYDALKKELMHFCETIINQNDDLKNIIKSVDALEISEKINKIISAKINS